MKRLIFLFLLFPLAHAAPAQIPEMPLPELLQGEQIIYLDSMLQQVEKDSSFYFFYTWYQLGKDAWTLQPDWRRKNYLLLKSGVTASAKGSPIALSGTFKWFTKNYSRLVAQEQFSNGRYSGQTIVYSNKGIANFIYDYDKKWDGQLWSYYYEVYKAGALVRSAFESFDMDKGRWKVLCTSGCSVNRDLH